jgi:hypothetical protein
MKTPILSLLRQTANNKRSSFQKGARQQKGVFNLIQSKDQQNAKND